MLQKAINAVGTLTPEDVEVIRASKIGTVGPDVVKWSRVNQRSNVPVFRWITFKLTPYGKQQEDVWKQNMLPGRPTVRRLR